MTSYRNNPESAENQAASVDNDRATFAAKMSFDRESVERAIAAAKAAANTAQKDADAAQAAAQDNPAPIPLKINPAYLAATHVALFIGHGFPSLEEQIEQDERAQERMEQEAELARRLEAQRKARKRAGRRPE